MSTAYNVTQLVGGRCGNKVPTSRLQGMCLTAPGLGRGTIKKTEAPAESILMTVAKLAQHTGWPGGPDSGCLAYITAHSTTALGDRDLHAHPREGKLKHGESKKLVQGHGLGGDGGAGGFVLATLGPAPNLNEGSGAFEIPASSPHPSPLRESEPQTSPFPHHTFLPKSQSGRRFPRPLQQLGSVPPDGHMSSDTDAGHPTAGPTPEPPPLKPGPASPPLHSTPPTRAAILGEKWGRQKKFHSSN